MNLQLIETDDDVATGLSALAKMDPILKQMVADVGTVPLRRHPRGFETLANIIIAQQVSRQSADAISGRLFGAMETPCEKGFMRLGAEGWAAAGLSRPKQRTLAALSEAITAGDFSFDTLHACNAQDAEAHMTAIKGIGQWTSNIYLMFAIGLPDIFPARDIALQNVARDAFGLKERPDEKALAVMAESWAPWRSVAARLFWAWYALQQGRAVQP